MNDDITAVYKLLIIGGGPAGIGVLVRAARLGYLPRLLHPEEYGTPKDLEVSERLGCTQRGVALLHAGDDASFGSGNLGSYVINSNTYAKSLVGSILDEKPELNPPESIKGTFLEKVKAHASYRQLEAAGNVPASLIDFGKFLNAVGVSLLQEVSNYGDISKCFLQTTATKVEVLENGLVRVEAEQEGKLLVFYAENLVLAMGGMQTTPVLENAAWNAKLFSSDHCLRADGFAQLKEHLLQAKDRKVCIVGGSHSSFSVAWLLLHRWHTTTNAHTRKPSLSTAAASVDEPASEPIPTAEPPVSNTESTRATATSELTDTAGCGSIKKEIAGEPVPSSPSVSISSTSNNGIFGPKDITILHRTPIRQYYMTRKEAEADGADGSRVDRTGCVNTFTGLREDSKTLYRDIRSGKETRVRLFQVNRNGSQSLTSKAYESASAIVWCCGYGTRMLPCYDGHGNRIEFLQDNNVLKVDLKGRLQRSVTNKDSSIDDANANASEKAATTRSYEPVRNVFGVGVGFSLRSAVDEMGNETRADGVTVYHRRGASLVLAALYGSEVYGKGNNSFEDMIEASDKKKKETITAKADQISQERARKYAEKEKEKAAAVPVLTAPHSAPKPPTGGLNIKIIKPVPGANSVEKGEKKKREPQCLLSPTTNNGISSSSVIVTNPPVKGILHSRRSRESSGGSVKEAASSNSGTPVKATSAPKTPKTSKKQPIKPLRSLDTRHVVASVPVKLREIVLPA